MEKENNNIIEINLSDFWKVLKRCWWLLLAVFVVVSAIVYLYMDYTHVDEYTATAKLYVLRTDSRTQYSDANFASAIIDDCVELILSEDNVIVPAIKMLAGSEYNESELGARVATIFKKVTVKSSGGDSHLIQIIVKSGTAEGAAKVANCMAQSAMNYLNGLYGQQVMNISDGAKVPKSISNPISFVKIGLIGFAAAALVYLAWLLVFLFDDRIDSEEKVEKRLGLTILGSIPYRGSANRRKSRYGTYSGYYGYGVGAKQKEAEAALSSGEKEARK